MEIDRFQEQYPSHILLCQVGSFYEIYDTGNLDMVSSILNLRIAKHKHKSNSIGYTSPRFAGFPVSSLKHNLNVLLKENFSIAIVDQYGKHKLHDHIVRKISRVITPGTLLADEDLIGTENNFLLSLYVQIDKKPSKTLKIGMAYLDVTTGEFLLSRSSLLELDTDLSRIQPREIILSHDLKGSEHPVLLFLQSKQVTAGFVLTFEPNSRYFDENARLKFASIMSNSDPLAGKILSKQNELETIAATALIGYIIETFPQIQPAFNIPSQVDPDMTLKIDASTLQSLEIVRSIRLRTRVGSLLSIIDQTKTSMGARLLSSRLRAPSTEMSVINFRLDLVDVFHADTNFLANIRIALSGSRDIERALQRMYTTRFPSQTDFITVISTIEQAISIQDLLRSHRERVKFEGFVDRIGDFTNLVRYGKSLFDQPDKSTSDINPVDQIGTISFGVNAAIDSLRKEYADLILFESKLSQDISIEWKCQVMLISESVYGPICEVTRNVKSARETFITKSKTSEFVTNLPDKYTKISSRSTTSSLRFRDSRWTDFYAQKRAMEERILALDSECFIDACRMVTDSIQEIMGLATSIAELDVASSCAQFSIDNGYVRPEMTSEYK